MCPTWFRPSVNAQFATCLSTQYQPGTPRSEPAEAWHSSLNLSIRSHASFAKTGFPNGDGEGYETRIANAEVSLSKSRSPGYTVQTLYARLNKFWGHQAATFGWEGAQDASFASAARSRGHRPRHGDSRSDIRSAPSARPRRIFCRVKPSGGFGRADPAAAP